MSTATHADPLLAGFPAHDPGQWRAAAEALLNGASFDARLVSRTHEGIDIPPVLMRHDTAGLPQTSHAPGFDSHLRGSRAAGFLAAGWEVSQELRANSPVELNARIHEGFAGGQSELNLVLAGDGASGLRVGTTEDLLAALDGVILDAISIWWQPQGRGLSLSALVFDAAQRLGADPASLRGGFEDDPLGEWLKRGTLITPLEERFDRMAALTVHCARHAPQLRTICATGDIHHNAGASATQELGHVIATIVTCIEELRGRGLDPATVLPHIRIRLAVGSDFFMEIAKIRATRCLWSRIAAIYGVTDAPVHIHASTSRWNKCLDDPHTNLLRVTAEAFAAVVGGADSLHIGPYDEITGASDAFSRRIARNLHAILREECGLDRVIDPAGGAYAVEWLTDRVAGESWRVFQNIERRGGMITAIADGSLTQAVNATADAKLADIRTRRQSIVGVNAYPDLRGPRLAICEPAPAPPEREENNKIPIPGFDRSNASSLTQQAIAAASSGASMTAIETALAPERDADRPNCPPLAERRAAEPYERLRDACDAFASRQGSRPGVLQLNIGPSRRYRSRADWTTAFFQVAGLEVDAARDFADAGEATSAIAASNAAAAVIVSDDATYADTVANLAATAKSTRPSLVLYVAGQPGDHESEWRKSGVDAFIHARSDNHRVNEELLQRIGVL